MFTFSLILLMSICAVLSNSIINLSIQDPNLFGPYNVNYTRLELCKGPRFKNSTSNTFTLSSEGYKFYGHMNLTFVVPAHIDDIKIVVYSLKDDEKIKSALWNYKLNNPCQHFVFGSIIYTYLKARDCNIKVGSYIATLDFEEIQSKFWGTSFFYGKFLLKVTVNSKKAGDLLCLFLGIVFTKKKI